MLLWTPCRKLINTLTFLDKSQLSKHESAADFDLSIPPGGLAQRRLTMKTVRGFHPALKNLQLRRLHSVC